MGSGDPTDPEDVLERVCDRELDMDPWSKRPRQDRFLDQNSMYVGEMNGSCTPLRQPDVVDRRTTL